MRTYGDARSARHAQWAGSRGTGRRARRGGAACLEARRYADRIVLGAKVGLEHCAARDAEGGTHLATDAADLVDHLAASVKVDLRDGEGASCVRAAAWTLDARPPSARGGAPALGSRPGRAHNQSPRRPRAGRAPANCSSASRPWRPCPARARRPAASPLWRAQLQTCPASRRSPRSRPCPAGPASLRAASRRPRWCCP